jgi:hypothetical protein
MNKMLVAGLESSFKVFDMRTQHPTEGFASATEKVFLRFYDLIRHPGLPPFGQPNTFRKIEIYLLRLEEMGTLICTNIIIHPNAP